MNIISSHRALYTCFIKTGPGHTCKILSLGKKGRSFTDLGGGGGRGEFFCRYQILGLLFSRTERAECCYLLTRSSMHGGHVIVAFN